MKGTGRSKGSVHARPEHRSGAAEFYGREEAERYTACATVRQVQRDLTLRAVELLRLEEEEEEGEEGGAAVVLDLGCGSVLSGQVLSELGVPWAGADVSLPMLRQALQHQGGARGGLLLSDMGQGLPFRGGAFSGAISISAAQWLCYGSAAPPPDEGGPPGAGAEDAQAASGRAIARFFSAVKRVLRPGAAGVLQVYLEDMLKARQLLMGAERAGLGPTLLADLPHAKGAAKYFVCLRRPPEEEPAEEAASARGGLERHPDSPLAWPLAGCCALQMRARPPVASAVDARVERRLLQLCMQLARTARRAFPGGTRAGPDERLDGPGGAASWLEMTVTGGAAGCCGSGAVVSLLIPEKQPGAAGGAGEEEQVPGEALELIVALGAGLANVRRTPAAVPREVAAAKAGPAAASKMPRAVDVRSWPTSPRGGRDRRLLRVSTANLAGQKVPPAVMVAVELEALGTACPTAIAAALWLRLVECGWSVYSVDCSEISGAAWRLVFMCWPAEVDWTDSRMEARRPLPAVHDLPGLFESLAGALPG